MRQLYVDCDGVVADLGKKIIEVFGSERWEDQRTEELYNQLTLNVMNNDAKTSDALKEVCRKEAADEFWTKLYAVPDLFEQLDPMSDAHELMDAVKHLDPIFLTGCPRDYWAVPQKMRWRDKHFPDVPMICLPSASKSIHCRPGDVIIDDWPKYRDVWERKGGIWVHHDDTASTLLKLRELGMIT